MASVRVALVSPYSYSYPGGVSHHVEALAEGFLARGHEARMLAPYDPDDRLARVLHRGAAPQRRQVPHHVVPLGRTVALNSNGARTNLALAPESVARLGRELRRGRYDVVHVHEPYAPLVSWCATEIADSALVGTFHAYSTARVANLTAANVLGARRLYNRLGVRIAVSEAARWTAERFYGGRYRIVPNGVDLTAAASHARTAHPSEGEPTLLYLGRADERKGLPVLLRAFVSLREAGLAARLVLAGPSADEVPPLPLDGGEVEVLGPVSEGEKWRLLGEADLLCAPSLRGESFGMVLVEALAAGTPVVCSAIPGYREVVRHGVEGLLVPPGEASTLATALRALALDRPLRERLAAAARARAACFAWPRVVSEVLAAYEEAVRLAAPDGPARRLGARLGVRPADGLPARPPRRLSPLEHPPPQRPGASPARHRRRFARGRVRAVAGGEFE
jgi:phosphatidylinositol alpha-mannosyltransferase